MIKEVLKKVTIVKISSIYSEAYSGKINFHYNKAGRLIRKDINSNGLGVFQQKFFYTEEGILSHFEIYKIVNENPKMYIKGEFEKYQQSNFSQLLKEDQN